MKVRYVLPIILSIMLVGGLLVFGGIQAILLRIKSFNLLFFPIFLALMAIYEYIRGKQWIYLLHVISFSTGKKDAWIAFLIGETSRDIPFGNYVQSIMLNVFEAKGIGSLSAISIYISIVEVSVALAAITILGVGEWSGWVRPLIIIGSAVFLIFLYTFIKLDIHIPFLRKIQHSFTFSIQHEINEFKKASVVLFHPKTLIICLLLTSCYLIIAAIGLEVIFHGLHIFSISLLDIFSAYFFSLAFSLIFPLPISIGVMEASGAGAFIAMGIEKQLALSALFIFHFFIIFDAIIFLCIFFFLWKDRISFLLKRK